MLTFATAGGTTVTGPFKDGDGGNQAPGTLGNQVPLLTFPPSITGGNFTLQFSNYISDLIAWSATPATLATNIRTALEAMPVIGTGNVAVTSLSATEYLVTFQGILGQRDVSELVVPGTSTGFVGTTAPLVVGTIYGGVATDTINNTINIATGAGGGGDITTGGLSLALGNTTQNNSITINTLAHAGANSAATLAGNIDLFTATRAITVNDGLAATDLNVSATFSGQTSAGLTLAGPGTIEYSGGVRQTYASNTTVNEGTLFLNKSVGPNILGLLTVGDNLGGPGADVVRYGAAAAGDQISGIHWRRNYRAKPHCEQLRFARPQRQVGHPRQQCHPDAQRRPGFSAEVRTGAGTLTLAGNLTVGQTNAPLTHTFTPCTRSAVSSTSVTAATARSASPTATRPTTWSLTLP